MMTRTATVGSQPGDLDGGHRLQLITCGRKEGVMQHPDILEAALAEDLEGSFERMVREYEDRLYSFAHRLSGDSSDAEEIAQDAFVRAYRALKTYPPERIRALSLKAWLYQITLNVARNRLRRKRHKLVSLDAPGPDGAFREPEDDPEERPDSRFERGRRRADIATLVAELPERYRSALILRYMEGLRLEEVASVLKQPLGTVKSNVHRAVNALREAMSESRRVPRVREVMS
jgi:RNA polymerase sigma-70 factor (ECF subfamily)